MEALRGVRRRLAAEAALRAALSFLFLRSRYPSAPPTARPTTPATSPMTSPPLPLRVMRSGAHVRHGARRRRHALRARGVTAAAVDLAHVRLGHGVLHLDDVGELLALEQRFLLHRELVLEQALHELVERDVRDGDLVPAHEVRSACISRALW